MTDQKRIDVLKARIVKIGVERERLAEEANSHRRMIDTLRTAERPTYPTDDHRQGIAEGARRILAGEASKDSHGEPTPTYAVVVAPQRGWLHIRHGAPYSEARIGGALWKFSDEEVAMFCGLLADAGTPVAGWWHSDGGLSVVVEPFEVPGSVKGRSAAVAACGNRA